MNGDIENEERIELESVAKEAQMIHATVNSKGWTNVIRPALEERVNALVNEFSNATVFEEFVRIQQSINAIQGVFDFIEIKLIEGKEALLEMRKEL